MGVICRKPRHRAVVTAGDVMHHWPLTSNANDSVGSVTISTCSGADFTSNGMDVGGYGAISVTTPLTYTLYGEFYNTFSSVNDMAILGLSQDTGKYAGLYFVDGSGILGYNSNSVGAFASLFPSTGATYKIVLTFSGTTVELFVNGISKGSKTIDTNLTLASINRVFIGTVAWNSVDCWQGIGDARLRNVKLWNKVLSSQEISAL